MKSGIFNATIHILTPSGVVFQVTAGATRGLESAKGNSSPKGSHCRENANFLCATPSGTRLLLASYISEVKEVKGDKEVKGQWSSYLEFLSGGAVRKCIVL